MTPADEDLAALGTSSGSRVETGRLLDWLADFPKGAAPHLVCNGGVGPAVLVIMLVLRRKGQPPMPVVGLTLRRRG